ncbi:Ankyrin repeat domain-containing protein 23 [Fusarium oxysporum f. sp. albedinis]|nr:Ankyrin repeat domain-containing protein 23 [Fusarium oxysporum f. sp. albedinis]
MLFCSASGEKSFFRTSQTVIGGRRRRELTGNPSLQLLEKTKFASPSACAQQHPVASTLCGCSGHETDPGLHLAIVPGDRTGTGSKPRSFVSLLQHPTARLFSVGLVWITWWVRVSRPGELLKTGCEPRNSLPLCHPQFETFLKRVVPGCLYGQGIGATTTPPRQGFDGLVSVVLTTVPW